MNNLLIDEFIYNNSVKDNNIIDTFIFGNLIYDVYQNK